MAGRLVINSVSRHRSDGSIESLEFKEGVNVLIGEGNTGKTKWFQTIDYLLGDEVSTEERQDPENVLFNLFDSASVVMSLNGEEVSVERKWREPGSLSKVYVNGVAENVKDYCRFLMGRLGIPLLHYPQGNPYSSRTWPELTWRILFRHVYRRETLWSDLADLQPEVDQHASLMLFLGAADRVFSQDYGDLVSKNKRLWELQSKRDQFMNMLDQVSKDLVDADELGVALTPESISSAQEKLTQEEAGIEARREALLRDIRESTEAHLVEEKVNVPDIGEASQTLVNLQSQQEEVGSAIRQIESRVTELSTVRQLLEDESSKLLRAREAGSVLADLRVTHCPACDRHLDQAPDDCSCYVCGRPVNGQQTVSASRRIEFESEQLQSVREETNQLLRELAEELKAKREVLRDVAEQLIQWKAVMRPVRKVAAALLPPELFFLDVSYGRVQEKGQQLTRLKAVLDQREQLAADIQKGKRRGYKLDCVNGHRKNDTKETRWPSTSTSLTNCWRITRSQKTSLAKTGY